MAAPTAYTIIGGDDYDRLTSGYRSYNHRDNIIIQGISYFEATWMTPLLDITTSINESTEHTAMNPLEVTPLVKQPQTAL
jgi:hypothetical protein